MSCHRSQAGWVAVLAAAAIGIAGCGPFAPGAAVESTPPLLTQPSRSNGQEQNMVPPADPTALPNPEVRLGPQAPAFFTAPEPPPDVEPGQLIWARPVAAPPGSRGYGILYWSTTNDGAPVAVSGVLFEPADAEPGTPRHIVGVAHSAVGLGDKCAPSASFFGATGPASPLIGPVIAKGWVYVESDYQGLGTPGEHPFVDAKSAGRNVLDSIKAAAELTGAGADADAVVIGQSQGGGAALLAAEQQPSYAPSLTLRGAVGIAAPSRLDVLDDQLAGGPYAGYLLMSVHGLLTAYPTLNAEARGLTPAGREALTKIREECVNEILEQYAGHGEAEYGFDRVLDAPDFAAALAQSDPGLQPMPVPVFIVHGELDDTIPVQNSRELIRRYCAAGGTVTSKFVGTAGHVDVSFVAQSEIMTYLDDRLAGKPASTSCG